MCELILPTGQSKWSEFFPAISLAQIRMLLAFETSRLGLGVMFWLFEVAAVSGHHPVIMLCMLKMSLSGYAITRR